MVKRKEMQLKKMKQRVKKLEITNSKMAQRVANKIKVLEATK